MVKNVKKVFLNLLNGVRRFILFLASPIYCNMVFVVIMSLLYILTVWREWMYETDTEMHSWHFVFDIYLLCVLLQLIPKNARRWIKRILYIVAYAVTFFEIFLMERFQIIYTPTSVNLWRETTGEESKEFFMAYCRGEAFWVTLGLCASLILLHVLLARLSRRIQQMDNRILPYKIFSLAFGVMVIIVVGMSVHPALHEKNKLWKFCISAEQAEKIKWQTLKLLLKN